MKIQFLGTPDDEPYLFHLSQALGEHKSSTSANLRKFEFISEVMAIYKKQGVTHIITTQEQLIKSICFTASPKEQKLSNYAGSMIEYQGIHFLFINPLKQCMTVSYGKFLLERYVSKITKPGRWLDIDPFSWNLMENSNQYSQLLFELDREDAIAAAIDIETRPDLSISSVSYTVITKTSIKTYVMPLPYGLDEDEYELRFNWLSVFNATYIPKIFQNGKYDNAYFQRYNIPVQSYIWDTEILHHSAYCELPKDLGTLGAFYLRNFIFWKNEGDADIYLYNAMDTYVTAVVFLQWMKEFGTLRDKYAVNNYRLTFAQIHPNFLMESTGLLVNKDTFKQVLAEQELNKDKALNNIREALGEPEFNPGSAQQTKKLLDILGCKDLKKADEKALKRAAFRHPLNHFYIDLIITYRKAAKLISTYLVEDKLFNNRFLYSLSPTTETGRNRSGSHAFWVGANIQNMPRKGGIKKFMEADEGFLLYESDFAQAESRDTAYITGDPALLANVNDPDKDFHKTNASLFFGVSYEEVDDELRQLGKPVNHGANYLMEFNTLIDSMGLPNIFIAAKRLGLPFTWTATNIAKHLLSLFDKAYPVVANSYPRYIQKTVKTQGRFTNPYGFTRICFGDPIKSREYLRSLVAFLPQGTNGQALGKAVAGVFKLWRDNYENLNIHAQIHDSLLYSVRIGHEHLVEEIEKIMLEASTIEVTDISGVTRTLVVPVDKAKGSKLWKG